MSFQVNYFQNNADLIEPGIEENLTLAFTRNNSNKPILVCQILMAIYFKDGEITSYRIV
jgi:hypothetical protein